MITVRELCVLDSNACIDLKKSRQRKELIEIRKKNFFGVYNALSANSFNLGAFSKESLVAICSFIKIDEMNNVFLVTDLVVDEKFKNERLPSKIFKIAHEAVFSKIQEYALIAVEENINALQPLKSLVESYGLFPLSDKYVYSHLIKVNNLVVVESANVQLAKASHPIDSNAQKIMVELHEVVFFTDQKYRSYSLNGKEVSRLYVSGLFLEGCSEDTLKNVIEAAQVIMRQRSLDFFVILSGEVLAIEVEHIYTNRVLIFSKNPNRENTIDLSKGILI